MVDSHGSASIVALQDIDDIFGTSIDLDRLIDVVAKIVEGFDAPFRDFLEHGIELLPSIAAQDQTIIDTQRLGRTIDVKTEIESFDSRLGVLVASPHLRIDHQISTPRGPTFFIGWNSLEGSEMKAQRVHSARPNGLCHGFQVRDRQLFGQQMSKGIDRVECGIVRLLDGKVAHVGNPRFGSELVFFQAYIAVVDGFRVEIQSVSHIPTLGHPIEQSTCPACGFEQSLDFAIGMFGKDTRQELILRFPIASEDQIVEDGIVIDAFDDGFHARVFLVSLVPTRWRGGEIRNVARRSGPRILTINRNFHNLGGAEFHRNLACRPVLEPANETPQRSTDCENPVKTLSFSEIEVGQIVEPNSKFASERKSSEMNAPALTIKQLAVDTIRTLSMDGVQAANSGHPGTPMALAPVTFQLWTECLRYDPAQPLWPNRDRFVLSCGHASMLLYSMIHLAGIKGLDMHGAVVDRESITIEDIKRFRQLHSPCAGHPEFGYAAGIETTTGPLGQGVGNSVGMAIASKHLGARYNKPGFPLIDYDVYALCSDGDLMEGISSEAGSIAAHLKLSNLCWIYDDNGITIEGHTDLAFTENVGKRFEGIGWNVLHVSDVNDLGAMQAAFDAFRKTTDKPTLIVVKSIIGFGSPNKANTHGAHGAPLGDEEIKLTKRAYGWPEDQKFFVPDQVRAYFAETIGAKGKAASTTWQTLFDQYKLKYPKEAGELASIIAKQLPSGWDSALKPFPADPKGLATRVSSGKVLNMLSPNLPSLVGGSADLAPSTMTLIDGQGDLESSSYGNRNMHFGIREHGMASVLNGMSLSGLRPYGATFFVFTDYMRPSMRLSSIMHQPVLYVLTHDSIGLGEDGPTHQPVEHLAACRAIPGLHVFRPGDANEVLHCYRAAMQLTNHPAAMVLSRQNVPTFDRTQFRSAAGAERGGYVLNDSGPEPKAILMATGTEVPIVVKAQEMLTAEGIATRVVSLPCFELFDAQDPTYIDSVLPKHISNRVGCEAGIRQGWDKYLGLEGKFVGMSTFGASGPFNQLYEHFKITPDQIVSMVKLQLG